MQVELKPFEGPEHLPFCLGEGPGSALLLHGFPGTPAEMQPLARSLAERGWHSCAPLLPGFGAQIGSLDRYTRQDWLEAIRGAWQAHGVQPGPRILLGYSMGGAMALNLADDLKPDGLVLIAPFLGFPGLLPRLVPVLRFVVPTLRPYEKADFSDPRIREQLRAMLNGANLDDPHVQAAIRQQVSLPLRTLNEILKLGISARRMAPRIEVPTLIFQGLQDETVDPALTRRLLPRLRNARLEYRELAAGHHVVQPSQEGFEALRQGLLSFVEALR